MTLLEAPGRERTRDAIGLPKRWNGPLLYPDEAILAEVDMTDSMPDIIEFVVSDRYLNRPRLYPRQATILKVATLQSELFTSYDEDVIAEWITNYERTGYNGIQPDIGERIEMCRAEGRRWFRDVLAAVGRRGSKGYIGAALGAYVLWFYILRGNPLAYYGITRGKQLAGFTFSGKKENAKANQWADIKNVIIGSECFIPYISRDLTESLTIYSRQDYFKAWENHRRRLNPEVDVATFLIQPKESVPMSGRGPAGFMLHFDEMAMMVAAGANRSAQEIWGAATPALDQFDRDAFIYEGSTTWQMIGQFYENWEQSLERETLEDGTTRPRYHYRMMLQLQSWDPYTDYELAEIHGFERIEPHQVIQEYDDDLRKEEEADPEGFSVERRSKWAASLQAYLSLPKIENAYRPWPDENRIITEQSAGVLARTYASHGDPSSVGKNFGFAIGHIEGPDERGLNHVVFDVIKAWIPSKFDGMKDAETGELLYDEEGNPINRGMIDYEEVAGEIEEYIVAFMPEVLSFDQFNSAATLPRLQRFARIVNLPKRTTVYERTATAPTNWKTAETFKYALNMDLVHVPYDPKNEAHELLKLEMQFLEEKNGKVDHPTAGPVQTKDIWDCVAAVTHHLLGEQISAYLGKDLGITPRGSQPGGIDPYGGQDPTREAFKQFGVARRATNPPAPGRPRRGQQGPAGGQFRTGRPW